MARCHRIGQTKEVKVYRLVTKATYEQSLFETSAKKYGLDEAVRGGGDEGGGMGSDKPGSAKDDALKINRLLKYGVHGALRDASGEEAAKFANEDIDDILSKRAESRSIGERKGNTFSTATFTAQNDEPDFDAEDFWAKVRISHPTHTASLIGPITTTVYSYTSRPTVTLFFIVLGVARRRKAVQGAERFPRPVRAS